MASYWQQLDFRIYKNFLLRHYTVGLLLEVENAFNAKIPRIINPYTGREYRPGDLLTQRYTRDYNPDPNPVFNPAKFRWPRTVRLGFSIRF
jgi:hypothetical protein